MHLITFASNCVRVINTCGFQWRINRFVFRERKRTAWWYWLHVCYLPTNHINNCRRTKKKLEHTHTRAPERKRKSSEMTWKRKSLNGFTSQMMKTTENGIHSATIGKKSPNFPAKRSAAVQRNTRRVAGWMLFEETEEKKCGILERYRSTNSTSPGGCAKEADTHTHKLWVR